MEIKKLEEKYADKVLNIIIAHSPNKEIALFLYLKNGSGDVNPIIDNINYSNEIVIPRHQLLDNDFRETVKVEKKIYKIKHKI